MSDKPMTEPDDIQIPQEELDAILELVKQDCAMNAPHLIMTEQNKPMSDTPIYCLGQNTIERVANESQLITDNVCFIAASDLYQKNPYNKIKELEMELETIKKQFRQLKNASRNAYNRIAYFYNRQVHCFEDYIALPPEVRGLKLNETERCWEPDNL